MRLIKENVERVAITDAAAVKLRKLGFRPIGGDVPEDKVGKVRSVDSMKVDELKALAKEKGVEGYESLTKMELLEVLKE